MARNKEDMQDKLLHQFEKVARKEDRSRPLTLQEQMDAAEAYRKMPESVKLQNMGAGAWQEEVCKLMNKMFHTGHYEAEKKMRIHFRKMDDFHQKGTPLAEVATWLEDQMVTW